MTAYKEKNVLIVGGLGFIGSNLARRLIELGSSVTVLDSMETDSGANTTNIVDISDQMTVMEADARDQILISVAIEKQDIVFNLAGQTSHADSMTDPLYDLAGNCETALSVLEACRLHSPKARIVFSSTRQVYGKPQYLPLDEKHPVQPLDVNGINKYAAEQYHRLYHSHYGLETCILRLTNTYGPRMRIMDDRQCFLGQWIRRALEGESFDIWGGSQQRDFTYVDDCVEALLLAGSSPQAVGKLFNVGGASAIRLYALAKILLELAPNASYEICDFPSGRKKIDIGDYVADDTQIRDTLGWRPCVDLYEGLRSTLAYYQDHLKHYLGPEDNKKT